MIRSWKGWLLERSQIYPVGMNVSVLIKLSHIKFYWTTEDTDWITRFNSFSVQCICGVVSSPPPPPRLSTSLILVFMLWKNLRLLYLQKVITRCHRWLDWSTKMFSSVHGVWLWGLAWISAVFSVSISWGLPEILWGSFCDWLHESMSFAEPGEPVQRFSSYLLLKAVCGRAIAFLSNEEWKLFLPGKFIYLGFFLCCSAGTWTQGQWTHVHAKQVLNNSATFPFPKCCSPFSDIAV